jgi:putative transposase
VLRENRDLKRRNRLLEQENEVLRRAAAHLSQAQLPGKLAAADAPIRVAVAVSCRVLKLHRQHYCAWLAQPLTAAELAEACLANAIFDAHCEDPSSATGCCSTSSPLPGMRSASGRCGRSARPTSGGVCSARNAAVRRACPGAPVHDDLVLRKFTAERPNELWLTDISEHPRAEGKPYICAIKDVWSNRIVGDSIADRMTSQLAFDALESAVARRGGSVAGCKLHSDRGGQGEFNRLSQHLVITEAFDGSSATRYRPSGASEVEVAWSPKFRRGVEAAFCAEIAKGLLPEEAAAVIGVAQAVGARWFHNAGEMPPFDLKQKSSGRYLSFTEREGIALLKAQDKGVREIARTNGRDPGTVSRELRRNAATRGGKLDYRASVAQWKADLAGK